MKKILAGVMCSAAMALGAVGITEAVNPTPAIAWVDPGDTRGRVCRVRYVTVYHSNGTYTRVPVVHCSDGGI